MIIFSIQCPKEKTTITFTIKMYILKRKDNSISLTRNLILRYRFPEKGFNPNLVDFCSETNQVERKVMTRNGLIHE